MKTLIQGGFVVGFDGTQHEIIKDGVVVYDGNRLLGGGWISETAAAAQAFDAAAA